MFELSMFELTMEFFVPAAGEMLQGLIFYCFCAHFAPCRLKSRWLTALLLMLIYLTIGEISSRNNIVYFDVNLPGYVIGTIWHVALGLLLFRFSRDMFFYTIITYRGVSMTIEELRVGFINYIDPIEDLWPLRESGRITGEQFFHLSRLVMFGQLFLTIFVKILLLAIVLYLIRRIFPKLSEPLSFFELVFLLVPAIFSWVLDLFHDYSLYPAEREKYVPGYTISDLDRGTPGANVISPILLFFVILIILTDTYVFRRMTELSGERAARMALEHENRRMNEQIVHIRSLKHDLKNQLSVVTALANDPQKSGALTEYLSELDTSYKENYERFHSGDSAVDMLLELKAHAMSANDIDFNSDDLIVPESFKLLSSDIVVLLGNALDNAIEACIRSKEKGIADRPSIELSSEIMGAMLLIRVSNDFDGEYSEKDGELVTVKSNKKDHGIGMKNMEMIAKKYHGAVEWEIKDLRFELSVLLQGQRT